MSTIVTFGDSITWGGYDSQGGWADRIKRQCLKTFIEGGAKWQLSNCGIGGNTSTDLLQRIEVELTARKREETLVVIAIGINDSRLVDEELRPEVDIEDFRNNVDQILSIAQKYSDRVLVVGLTSVANEEHKYKNYVYSHERISDYDDVLTGLASKYDVEKVDVLKQLQAKGSEVLFRDGLHLNDAGHEVMAGIIWSELSRYVK